MEVENTHDKKEENLNKDQRRIKKADQVPSVIRHMRTKTFLITSILFAVLLIPMFMTGFVEEEKSIIKTYWQVEEPRGSTSYYIRWEVTATTDSLQFIYYCGGDTTYSEIKNSSNGIFKDLYVSQCALETKVVINPFEKNQQYVEYINIPFIISLPDTL